MLHFVLADINPNKAKKFKPFLKVMNDITLLVTVASGPAVSHKSLHKNKETGAANLDLTEGGFQVVFNGVSQNGQVVNGAFMINEERRNLLELSYSVRDGEVIALRVKLNCDSEDLVRTELERAFKRDFSQEAHEIIDTPLEELQESQSPELVAEPSKSTQSLPDEVSKIEVHNEINAAEDDEDEDDAENELDEITEDLGVLTEKVKKAINDTESIVRMLNDLSHDLTRGAAVDFGERKAASKALDNGAQVEMIDDEAGAYRITFRKGSLEKMTEVSFFLEKEGELIFSIYLSSEGVGKIATTSEQSDLIFKRVKEHLL